MKRNVLLWTTLIVSIMVLMGAIGMVGRQAATGVSISAPSVDGEMLLIPYPQYRGFPYGDCYRQGVSIGYTIESSCTEVIGGDSWVQDTPESIQTRRGP